MRRLSHWLLSGATALALLATAAVRAQEPAAPATAKTAAVEPPPQISKAIVEAHVTKLASDEMKGRDTKSGGVDIAADYLVEVMKQDGLKPGGSEEGSYFHSFTIGKLNAPLDEQVLSTPTGSITPAGGFMLLAACQGEWSGPLLFGGTGGEEEIASISDEAIRGAAVIVRLAGALFEPAASQTLRDVAERARGRGARLVVGVAARDLPGRMWSGFALRRMAGRNGSEADIVTPESTTSIPAVWCEQRGLAALIGPKAADVLASAKVGEAVKTLANDDVPAEAVVVTLKATAAFADPTRYRNVIGVVEGTDPKLKHEVVILSAHYDHIGMHPNENLPDRIFNGADDDASGTAAILAMGAAFAKNPPKRTVLVLAFTAEEKGLLGSKYYVQHPTVPLARVVANVNVEMIGRPAAAGPGALWITGYERSSFGPIVALAAAPAGVTATADPYAMMGFFRRSDNYSFAQAGIPAHTCSSYNARGARYYHQPNDHAADCDFGNMAVLVHGIYLGARAIAMGEATPQWVAGDPLARKRR